MVDRTMPDWKKIADLITDRDDLVKELQTAYEMGYSAGYIDGDTKAWQSEWDSSYLSKEDN